LFCNNQPIAVESVQRAAADWTCLFVTAGPQKNRKGEGDQNAGLNCNNGYPSNSDGKLPLA
jgi:hypothetical protein